MAFNINAQVILSGPKNLNRISRDIQSQLNKAGSKVNLSLGIDKSAISAYKNISSSISTMNNGFKSLNSTLQKTNNLLSKISTINSTVTATSALLTKQQQNLAKSNTSVSKSANSAARGLDAFGRQAAASLRAATAFALTTRAVFGLNNAIQSGIRQAIDYEKALIQIAQATNTSVKDLGNLKNTVNELSISLGVNANEVLETARVLTQAGLSARDTEEALKALTKSTLSGTFGDISETTEGLIAALSQFRIAASESETVLASLNEVSKRFAVESEDLISAIRRAGGVFSVAANDAKDPIEALQQLAAIFTSVRSTTRESAETIATGLRTIFTRIQRKSTIDFLKNLGIELVNTEGQFVGLYEAFRRLSVGLDEIIAKGDAVSLSAIVEELGGVRQAGKLIPAIKEFARAEAALKAAQEGAAKGLTGDVDKALQGLGTRIAQTQAKFQDLIRSIVESDTFQNLARFALDTADAFIDLANTLKPLLPIIATIGSSFLARGAVQFAGGFFSGLNRGSGQSTLGQVGSTVGRTITGGTTVANTQQNTTAINNLLSVLNTSNTNLNNLNGSLQKLIATVNNNTSALNRLSGSGRSIMGSVTRRSSGGSILGFARGGMVPGEGNSDTVPAMLTPGEFVIRKSSVEKIGASTLAAMNENKYAGGTGSRGVSRSDINQPLSTTGIYDSDKIPGGTNDKKAILSAILSSKKPYQVISGPAGSGKTTLAKAKYGNNFILSAADINKYVKFVVLSGASKTKSGDFSEDAQAIFKGATDITVLNPSPERLMAQRQDRINKVAAGNISDLRSENAIKATLKAPLDSNVELFSRYPNVNIVDEYNQGGRVVTESLDSLISKSQVGKGKKTIERAIAAGEASRIDIKFGKTTKSPFINLEDSQGSKRKPDKISARIIPQQIPSISRSYRAIYNNAIKDGSFPFKDGSLKELTDSAENRIGKSFEGTLIRLLDISGDKGWEPASSKTNYPVDLKKVIGDKTIVGEVKFKTNKTLDIDLISKKLRYLIDQKQELGTENNPNQDEIINVGDLQYFSEIKQKQSFIDWMKKNKPWEQAQTKSKRRKALGGLIQRFNFGGEADKLPENVRKLLDNDEISPAQAQKAKNNPQLLEGFKRKYAASKIAAKAKAEKEASTTQATLKSNLVGGLFLRGTPGNKNINQNIDNELASKVGYNKLSAQIYGGVLDPNLEQILAKEFAPQFTKTLEGLAQSIIGQSMIPGLMQVGSPAEIVNSIDQNAIKGYMFEGLTSVLTGAKLSNVGANFDFVDPDRNSLDRINRIFKPDVKSDTRFLDGKPDDGTSNLQNQSGSIGNKIVTGISNGQINNRYVKRAKGSAGKWDFRDEKAYGGIIQRFANGSIVKDFRRTFSNYGNDSYGMSIASSLGSSSSTLNFNADDTSDVYVDMFRKAEQAPKGAGSILLKQIIQNARKYKAKTISGNFVTPQALAAFAKVVDKSTIEFSDRFSKKKVNISYADALKDPSPYIATAKIPLKVTKPIRRASGGAAPSDTVPALLTPGEFVINKQSAQRIGYGNLNRMNKHGVTGFAKGGSVGVQRFANGGQPINLGSTRDKGFSTKLFDSLLGLSKSAQDATFRFQQYQNLIKQGMDSQKALEIVFKGLADVTKKSTDVIDDATDKQKELNDTTDQGIGSFSKLIAFESLAGAVTSATVAIQSFDIKNPISSIVSLGFAASQVALSLKLLAGIDLAAMLSKKLASIASVGPKNIGEGFLQGANLEIENFKQVTEDIKGAFKSFNPKNIKGSFKDIFGNIGKLFKGANLSRTGSIDKNVLSEIFQKSGLKLRVRGKGDTFNVGKVTDELKQLRGKLPVEKLGMLDDVLGNVTKSAKGLSTGLKLGSLAIKGFAGGLAGLLASALVDPIVNSATDLIMGKKQEIGSFGFRGRSDTTAGQAATAGGIGGAISGAVTGAALGAFLGPVGAAVGAALGGLIGGITGAITESLQQAAFNELKKLGDFSKDAGKSLDIFNSKTEITIKDIEELNNVLKKQITQIQPTLKATNTASLGITGGIFGGQENGLMDIDTLFQPVLAFFDLFAGTDLSGTINQYLLSFVGLDRAYINGSAAIKSYGAVLEQIGPENIEKANQAMTKSLEKFVNDTINLSDIGFAGTSGLADAISNIETLNVDSSNIDGVAASYEKLDQALVESAKNGDRFAQSLRDTLQYTSQLNILDQFNKQLQIIGASDPRKAGEFSKSFQEIQATVMSDGIATHQEYRDAIKANADMTEENKKALLSIVDAQYAQINAQIAQQASIAKANKLLAESSRLFDAFVTGLQRFASVATGSISQFSMATQNMGDAFARITSDTQQNLSPQQFNPFENIESATAEQITGGVARLKNFVTPNENLSQTDINNAFAGTEDFAQAIKQFPMFLKEGIVQGTLGNLNPETELTASEALDKIKEAFQNKGLEIPPAALEPLLKQLQGLAGENETISIATLQEQLKTGGDVNELLGNSQKALIESYSETYNALQEFEGALVTVSNLQLELARRDRQFRVASFNRQRQNELTIAKMRSRSGIVSNEVGFAEATLRGRLKETTGTSDIGEITNRRAAALAERDRLEQEKQKMLSQGAEAEANARQKNEEAIRQQNEIIESSTEALKDFAQETDRLAAIQSQLAASRAREQTFATGITDILKLSLEEQATGKTSEQLNEVLRPIQALQAVGRGEAIDARTQAMPLLDALMSGNNAAFEGYLQIAARESGMVTDGKVDQAKLEEYRENLTDQVINQAVEAAGGTESVRGRQLEPLLRGMNEARKRERDAQTSLINLASDIAKEQERVLNNVNAQDQTQMQAILATANTAFNKAVEGFQQAVKDLAILREQQTKGATSAIDQAKQEDEAVKQKRDEAEAKARQDAEDKARRAKEGPSVGAGTSQASMNIGFMGGGIGGSPALRDYNRPATATTTSTTPVAQAGADSIAAPNNNDSLLVPPPSTPIDVISGGRGVDTLMPMSFDEALANNPQLGRIAAMSDAALTPGSIYCNVHGQVLDNILAVLSNILTSISDCCMGTSRSSATTAAISEDITTNNVPKIASIVSTAINTIASDFISPFINNISNAFKARINPSATISDETSRVATDVIAPGSVRVASPVLNPALSQDLVRNQPLGSLMALRQMKQNRLNPAGSNNMNNEVSRKTTEQKLEEEIAQINEKIKNMMPSANLGDALGAVGSIKFEEIEKLTEARGNRYNRLMRIQQSPAYQQQMVFKKADQAQIQPINTENVEKLLTRVDQTLAGVPETIETSITVAGRLDLMGASDIASFITDKIISAILPHLPTNKQQPVQQGDMTNNQ